VTAVAPPRAWPVDMLMPAGFQGCQKEGGESVGMVGGVWGVWGCVGGVWEGLGGWGGEGGRGSRIDRIIFLELAS
jgi:hypothetical protein